MTQEEKKVDPLVGVFTTAFESMRETMAEGQRAFTSEVQLMRQEMKQEIKTMREEFKQSLDKGLTDHEGRIRETENWQTRYGDSIIDLLDEAEETKKENGKYLKMILIKVGQWVVVLVAGLTLVVFGARGLIESIPRL